MALKLVYPSRTFHDGPIDTEFTQREIAIAEGARAICRRCDDEAVAVPKHVDSTPRASEAEGRCPAGDLQSNPAEAQEQQNMPSGHGCGAGVSYSSSIDATAAASYGLPVDAT